MGCTRFRFKSAMSLFLIGTIILHMISQYTDLVPNAQRFRSSTLAPLPKELAAKLKTEFEETYVASAMEKSLADPIVGSRFQPYPEIDIQLAVLVLSARDLKIRRDAIHATWGNGHSNVFFIIGKHCPFKPEQRKSGVCEPKTMGIKIDPNIT